MKKKKRLKLSKVVSNLLILSGVFQTAVLQIHIRMINNLFSTIIGFYLFSFLLFTIINILNGANFTAKKSKLSIAAIYLITGVQMLFAGLYINVVVKELNLFAEVVMNTDIIMAISFLVISVAASVVASITAVVFYFKISEVDLYLG